MEVKGKINTYNNNKEARKGEIVSSGCLGSARGLAKLAAIMANKGSLEGNKVLSE